LSAEGADSPCLLGSFSNCSKYILIVAPAEPVPDRRKITLAESPVGYSKLRMRPCFDACEPSTGSVYLVFEED
jgi:hypothetical protein